MSEIEYVELEGEVLPALAIGVKRLSDGLQGLKLQIETLNKQIIELREESNKLAKLLESNKQLIDKERQLLVEKYEEFVKTVSDLLGKLQAGVKSVLELELSNVSLKLGSFLDRLDDLAKDVSALMLEERDRALHVLEEVKSLKGEVLEMKNKIGEMSVLVYSLELRLSSIEEKLENDLAELKLLVASSALQPAARASGTG